MVETKSGNQVSPFERVALWVTTLASLTFGASNAFRQDQLAKDLAVERDKTEQIKSRVATIDPLLAATRDQILKFQAGMTSLETSIQKNFESDFERDLELNGSQNQIESLGLELSEFPKQAQILRNIANVQLATYLVRTTVGTGENSFVTYGTAFHLGNGDLITAKHIIVPWLFDEELERNIARIEPEYKTPGVIKIEIFAPYSQGSRNAESKQIDFAVGAGISAKVASSLSSVISDEFPFGPKFARNDIALLNAQLPPEAASVKISEAQELHPGTDMVVIGYTEGFRPQSESIVPLVTKGVVSLNYDSNGNIRSDAIVRGGNSGGPVINPVTGEVIGVCIAANNKDGTCYSYLHPASMIREVLK